MIKSSSSTFSIQTIRSKAKRNQASGTEALNVCLATADEGNMKLSLHSAITNPGTGSVIH